MHKLKVVSTNREDRFDDAEAARRLGVSVEVLRLLVRKHLAGGEGPPDEVYTYRRADLIALQMFLKS